MINNEKLNIFIIGPSGCGKSTQAEKISKKYNLSHFSMGELFRNKIKQDADFQKKVSDFVDNGKWVPNEIVFQVLTPTLAGIDYKKFIIDGFPREVGQMQYADKIFKEKQGKIDLVIHLDVTAKEIADRRDKVDQAGGKFQENRNDETIKAIAQRQKSYDESINPIFDYLNTDCRLLRINGNRPINPIFEDITDSIDKLLINKK
jgi:adenylate kinase